MELLREHNVIVRGELTTHDGREVKHTGDGIMAAFTSVQQPLRSPSQCNSRCTPATKRQRHHSMSASESAPVNQLPTSTMICSGAAVQLAARLCGAAPPGEIAVSVAVRELCIGKPFLFEDGGQLNLKGLSEPTQTYTVSWHG